MSDIVAELRSAMKPMPVLNGMEMVLTSSPGICDRAAAEITRLRGEISYLKDEVIPALKAEAQRVHEQRAAREELTRQDKRAHGAFYRGGGRKRISFVDAEKMRAMAATMTQDEIAKSFGISRRNVGWVLSGETHQSQDNREKIATTLKKYGRPMTYVEVASLTGIKPSSASSMLYRMKVDGAVIKVPRLGYVAVQAQSPVSTQPGDSTRSDPLDGASAQVRSQSTEGECRSPARKG